MIHEINIKENNGFYSVILNNDVIAYGMTKDQADWHIRGIEMGIKRCGKTFVRDDNFYEVMCSDEK